MVEVTRDVVGVILAVLFFEMEVGHFVPRVAHTMTRMIPTCLQFREPLSPTNRVYVTGVCELAGGIAPPAAQHPERLGQVAVPFWPRRLAQLALMGLLLFAAG